MWTRVRGDGRLQFCPMSLHPMTSYGIYHLRHPCLRKRLQLLPLSFYTQQEVVETWIGAAAAVLSHNCPVVMLQ